MIDHELRWPVGRRWVPALVLTTVATALIAAAGLAPAADARSQLRISITSPRAQAYRLGSKVRVRFSCVGRRGIPACHATLARVGDRARPVRAGASVQPAAAGRYVFRVTAASRQGQRASKAVKFQVLRMISWSGYEWIVRPDSIGGPGGNLWADSQANVRVQGSRLRLSIVKNAAGRWTSAEVDNTRHLGYGTYRWVVTTDLGALDANEVLGLFTYGGPNPSHNEIEFEASHWGNLAWNTGYATVWQNAARGARVSASFNYSDRPPYVHQFTWSRGRITFLVTDASGNTLLDWTATSGVPRPSDEVPIINYWRVPGAAPESVRTMTISSFAWAPLGRSLPAATARISGPVR